MPDLKNHLMLKDPSNATSCKCALILEVLIIFTSFSCGNVADENKTCIISSFPSFVDLFVYGTLQGVYNVLIFT